jgi:hypothetical protein
MIHEKAIIPCNSIVVHTHKDKDTLIVNKVLKAGLAILGGGLTFFCVSPFLSPFIGISVYLITGHIVEPKKLYQSDFQIINIKDIKNSKEAREHYLLFLKTHSNYRLLEVDEYQCKILNIHFS